MVKSFDSNFETVPFSYEDWGFNARNFILENEAIAKVFNDFSMQHRSEILELLESTYTNLVCADFLKIFDISEDTLMRIYEIFASEVLVQDAIFDCLHNMHYDMHENIIRLITTGTVFYDHGKEISEQIVSKLVENKFNGNLLIKKVEDKKVKLDI